MCSHFIISVQTVSDLTMGKASLPPSLEVWSRSLLRPNSLKFPITATFIHAYFMKECARVLACAFTRAAKFQQLRINYDWSISMKLGSFYSPIPSFYYKKILQNSGLFKKQQLRQFFISEEIDNIFWIRIKLRFI